jgi:hypothetical protein
MSIPEQPPVIDFCSSFQTVFHEARSNRKNLSTEALSVTDQKPQNTSFTNINNGLVLLVTGSL